MSKTVTVEVPDEVYETLQKISQRTGTPLELLAVEWLAKYGPRPVPKRTADERRKAREGLLRLAGTHHSGDLHASENERIDADLAREYLSGHDPRP